MQQTLARSFTLQGIGLHSGQNITMSVHRAPEDHGIIFCRTDVVSDNTRAERGTFRPGLSGATHIPAIWDRVVKTPLCTEIVNENGIGVKTIEHLMAALRGCGIDNALVELDGPEVPSLDGSSRVFVAAIQKSGVEIQLKDRLVLQVLKTVTVEKEGKKAVLSPCSRSEFHCEIEYNHPLIGRQSYKTALINGNFAHDLAATRSFCLREDIEKMKKAGLIKGGSLDNAVVLDGDKVLNPEGLRCKDEFVRHKLLDAVGDLYLAGGVILGAYYGLKGGHAMNNALLRTLFSDKRAYCWVEEGTLARYPEKEARKTDGFPFEPGLKGANGNIGDEILSGMLSGEEEDGDSPKNGLTNSGLTNNRLTDKMAEGFAAERFSPRHLVSADGS